MKKSKVEIKIDKLQDNIEALKAFSAKSVNTLYKQIGFLKERLVPSTSLSIEKQEKIMQANLESLEDLEKKISTWENGLNETMAKLSKEYQRFKNETKEIEEERKSYKILYELSTAFYSERDINALLDLVLDSVIDLMSANLGVLQIFDENKNLKLNLAKDSEKNIVEEAELKTQLIETVLDSGSSICVNGLIDSIDEDGEIKSKISLICIPLIYKEGVLGIIYLEDNKEGSFFSTEDVELLSHLGERVGTALENNLIFLELQASQEKLLQDLRGKFKFDEILGNSPQMVEVLKTVADVADTEATVLIEGESGTGKELLARAIHFNSSRSKRAFVPINCAAIPETLLESELFGYEKGAFTGASQRKLGKFEVANGGTVFLDEIGDLSLLLQVKLLRFLQSHEFEPLGSTKVKRADVRIITATNKNLPSLVKEEKFREDLFYRINVINLRLPPLRERRLDIAPLAQSFVKKFSEKTGKKIKEIEPEALNALVHYEFPGNVRELENLMERAVILAKGESLTLEDFPENIFGPKEAEKELNVAENYAEFKLVKRKVVEKVEKDFLKFLLDRFNHNISEASKSAGMNRRELQRLLSRHKNSIQT